MFSASQPAFHSGCSLQKQELKLSAHCFAAKKKTNHKDIWVTSLRAAAAASAMSLLYDNRGSVKDEAVSHIATQISSMSPI